MFAKPVIVCSHHKSGTNYSLKVFKEISRELDGKMWMKFYEPDAGIQDWTICFHQQGRIEDLLVGKNFRGWHCIRHPKAIIFSAMIYHQKCQESWVDIPLDKFSSNTFFSITDGKRYAKIKDPGVSVKDKMAIVNSSNDLEKYGPSFEAPYSMNGQSYRQVLSSFESVTDKLLFEMRTFSRGVINDILNFPADKRFYTIKIEDISHDEKMCSLTEAFVHLGFCGENLLKCLDIASKQCLWKIGASGVGSHSTTGVSDQWRDLFKGEVEKEYRNLFGWAEEALGYTS